MRPSRCGGRRVRLSALLAAVSLRIGGDMASRSTLAIGPAALLLLMRAAI